MKWSLREPEFGDMVRVKVRDMYHYGIYAADTEIIEFGPPPVSVVRKDSEIKVCVTDCEGFLAGGFMECADLSRKEKKDRNSPEQTVENARKRIGEGGYNIIHNNCEHFANECMFGKAVCTQTESVRDFFRRMPLIDVYVAKTPFRTQNDIAPKERMSQIENISNAEVREHKTSVWHLLDYALSRSFGSSCEKADLTLNPGGYWECKKYFVSLSHCDGAVAVCVSKAPCGVDIEPESRKMGENVASRVLTEAEKERFSSLPEDKKPEALLEMWTRKESIFKSMHMKSFRADQIESDVAGCVTKIIDLGGVGYVVSVATDTPEKIRCYLPEGEKIDV